MKMTQDDVKQYIPHREPMLLVDRIIDCDCEKETIHAQYDVKKEWDILRGHFPGSPIMPGVLITEACAQASGVLSNMILGKKGNETLLFFMAIEKVRFRAPVRPDSILDMKIEIFKRKGPIFKFKAKAYVGETLTTECEFTAKVIDK